MRNPLYLAGIPLVEITKFWIDQELGNLEVLHATYTQHVFSPHFHDEYAIGVIVNGQQSTVYQHKQQIMPEKTVCIINPGELHTGHAADAQGWTYRMIYPNPTILQEIRASLTDKPSDAPFFPNLVIEDHHLYDHIFGLHKLLENPHTPVIQKESSLFHTLSYLMMRYADEKTVIHKSSDNRHYLQQARDYIEAHYNENISLSDIADAVHISRYHLLRMFTRHYGMSPHVYITHRRIQEAKRLLFLGSSIADVAYRVGFVDQSHLTKRFKQIIGITPALYH